MSGIWVASWCAAALFFIAGFLTARRRAQAAEPLAVLPARPGLQERAMRGRVTDVDELVAAERAAKLELERELMQVRVALERQRGPGGEGLATRAAAAEARASAAERRAEDAERRASAAERRARDGEALRRERDALAAQLAQARERVAQMEASVDGDARRQLAMEVEVLRSRAGEAEALRDENAALRAIADERGRLVAELEELQREVADLRAQGFARAPSAPPRLARPRNQGGTARDLEALVGKLRTVRGFRSAALADDLGLPIVGVGEHTAPLAAFAAYVDEIARKVKILLPLGSVRRIQLEDENGISVSASSLAGADATFVLAVLSAGPGPGVEQLQSVLRSAAALF